MSGAMNRAVPCSLSPVPWVQQMPVEIRVPPLGESVVEATVGRWSKQEGDAVRKDDVLVELETDKITVEVAAPADGTLGGIRKKEGDTVGVNELLAEMEAGAAPAAAEEGRVASVRYEEKAEAAAPASPASTATATAEAGSAEAPTSPAARAIAAEHGLDLATVRGSGPNGRVT